MSAALMNVYVTIIEAQNRQVSLGRSAGLWSKKKKKTDLFHPRRPIHPKV